MQSANNSLTLKERLNLKRFIKGEKASSNPVTLNHRQIFILPSGQGLFFAMTLILMLIVSLNYNISLGFILTFLLGSLSVVSIFHCFQNLAELNFQIKPIKPVFAGEPTTVNVQLINHSRPRWGVILSRASNKKRAIKKNIAANETLLFPLSIEGKGRGCHTVGTIKLSTLFPLGLFRAWSPINSSQTFLVYPKPSQSSISFHYKQPYNAQQSVSNKAGEEEFSGLTHYKPGDPIKRIDWKSLPKERGVYIKQFDEDSTTEVILDWESVPGPTTDEKLSQLCRQVLEAENGAIRYGLNLPGLSIPPARGMTHYEAVLKQLALFQL